MNIKVLFHVFLIFNFFILISCGDKNPTPLVESPEKKLCSLKAAQELWQRIKPLDLSKRDQAIAAMNILQPTLDLPESQKLPIVRELAQIQENSIGILNKILQAEQQEIDFFADFITAAIDSLPNAASKKAWLETSNGSIDLLSRLLTCLNVVDRPLVKTLLDKMSEIAPTTKNALENMWFVVKNINFAKRNQFSWNCEDKSIYAFGILMNLTLLPAHSMRREISQGLALKNGMAGTDSGLLQSFTQGPIDANIVKLCEVLFADQADNTARKNLANQKLGALTEPALHYLNYKNISGQAPGDGPGVRLSTGALAEETPHLKRLMALLTKNGASLQ